MKLNEIQIRDPFVLKANGKYYLYGSTDPDIWLDAPGIGFDVYWSEDLLNWEGPVQAFRPLENFWGQYNFWAPEVFLYQGRYCLFATFRGKRGFRGTGVLVANSPLGPFEPLSEGPLTPPHWPCLDGTLYVDESNQPWLVFCHEWIQTGNGTICGLKLSKDLKRGIGEPIELFKSSDANWSQQAYSPSNQISGYVTDGCYLHLLANGKLAMLWSCVGKKGYCLGYGISHSGKLLDRWEQAKEPLFFNDGGHGMLFTTYEGQLMLALHRPNETPKERALLLPLEETENGFKLVLDSDNLA